MSSFNILEQELAGSSVGPETSEESQFAQFGLTEITSPEDEGILNLEWVRNRILQLLQLNIVNFQKDSWTKKNRVYKLLIDSSKAKDKCLFTVRLGGRKIFRSICVAPTNQIKVRFLSNFYDFVSTGKFDLRIKDFCAKQSRLAEERKEAKRQKRHAEHLAAVAAEKRAKAMMQSNMALAA